MSSASKTVVTIEGSVTPSVVLPRGERKTVVLTSRIQKLIDRGFVNVVTQHTVKTPTQAPVKKPAVKTVPTTSNG